MSRISNEVEVLWKNQLLLLLCDALVLVSVSVSQLWTFCRCHAVLETFVCVTLPVDQTTLALLIG